MKRRLTTTTIELAAPAATAVTRFRHDPATWLPDPATPEDGRSFQVGLWAGHVGAVVHCLVGPAVRAGAVTGRRVQWQPRAGGLDPRPTATMPVFDGDLLVVEHDAQPPELTLVGVYEPPGGVVGGLLDTLALRMLAASTARSFLTAVGEHLRASAAPAEHLSGEAVEVRGN